MFGRTDRNVKLWLNRRQQQYDGTTERIRKELQPALTAIEDFIEREQGTEFRDRVHWVAFSHIKPTPSSQREGVEIFGEIRYNAGEEYFDDNGNYVTALSEEQARELTVIFSVALPMELAETGSKVEIMEYLDEVKRATEQSIAKLKEQLLSDEYDEEGEEVNDEDMMVSLLQRTDPNIIH